jgi:hypothetical protein
MAVTAAGTSALPVTTTTGSSGWLAHVHQQIHARHTGM